MEKRRGLSAGLGGLMPANDAPRAVALQQGTHRLRVECARDALRFGALVSALAWLAWIGIAWRDRGRERRRTSA